ncbi:Uncharacterised protein [Shewanella putrefaciens]|nr:Uncharacterised protein [Shewanella putrefaciens]
MPINWQKIKEEFNKFSIYTHRINYLFIQRELNAL